MKIKSLIIALLPVLVISACMNSKPIQPDMPEVKDLAAPTGVAVSGEAGTTTLAFQWSAVTGASQYKYRLLKGNTQDKAGTANATSVTFSGLTPGTLYRFDVCAASGATESPWSARIEARTKSEDQPQPSIDPASRYAEMKIPAVEEDGAARAFPGAEGGGMYTTGGRGGKVCHVTTLADSGTGSLREAIGMKGPRTIVFDVAGRIELKSDLRISNGDLTIAGQTAPGSGICISGGTVRVDAGNVIIRFIRFRLGDEGGTLGDSSDTIWGRYQSDIILDHCSMSWGVDEVASFYANRNFTMQWCIIAEALRYSIHSKGPHGYGGIWGGKNASFHHNLMANNDSRNARIDHPGIYIQSASEDYRATHRGNVDYRNNVIYNWGSNSTYGGEDGRFNIVGNFYKPGPASTKRNYFVDAYWFNSSSNIGTAYPEMYLSMNHHAAYTDIDSNGESSIYWHDQGSNPAHILLTTQLPVLKDDVTQCFNTTHSAQEAFDRVALYGGASLSRDDVDKRLIEEMKTGKATCIKGSVNTDGKSINGLIDSQKDVGGWPEYTASDEQKALVRDSDGDGMPDWFEEKYGLSKSDAADGSAKTIDTKGRYTNLEMYLHYLVRDITAGQSEGGKYSEIK